jgi:hypothetical protein
MDNTVTEFFQGVVVSEIANWVLAAPSSSSSSDESESCLIESDDDSDHSDGHYVTTDDESDDAPLRFTYAMFERNEKPKITSYIQDVVQQYSDEDVSIVCEDKE